VVAVTDTEILTLIITETITGPRRARGPPSPLSHRTFTGRTPMQIVGVPTLAGRERSTMDPLASSPEFSPYVESAEADDVPSAVGQRGGLAALLVVASPFALAAWVAIGVAISRTVA
jgi:hypothetical protein